METKKIIIKAVIGIVSILAGYYLTDKGMTSPSESTLAEYSKLCKQSVKTTGFIDSSYTKMSVGVIKGAPKKDFNVYNYTYKVNGQEYSGSYTNLQNSLPDSLTLAIWYDPANPSSHVSTDPCKQYEFSKARQYPSWFSYIGLPMLIVGVVLLYGIFTQLIRSMFKSAIKK
ncbi:MAG TPA: hypothetical protein VNB90_07620 [Cytophagaceae bacterium]|nr:hypothetical protein [Cytophagaceae bacterium]